MTASNEALYEACGHNLSSDEFPKSWPGRAVPLTHTRLGRSWDVAPAFKRQTGSTRVAHVGAFLTM
jgi:hypothetical protein